MKLILDRGAEVDSQDYDAYTPLHHSSWWQKQGRAPTNGSVECSCMLIEHGANIHAVNSDGKTPFQLALDAHRQDMAGLRRVWALLGTASLQEIACSETTSTPHITPHS
jgi:ankyrin repeat protein